MPEDQNLEYKESWKDEYLKWICGFANAQGGKIFIGINDKEEIKGIDNFKKLMEDIPNKVVSIMGIVVDVNLYAKANKHFLEIIIYPSSIPISYHGIYHYRSGSTKQELKGIALQQFLLNKIGKTWDDLTIKKASLNDIDGNTLKTFLHMAIESKRIALDASVSNLETIFSNLHLLDEDGRLKNAAVLLFYENPLKYFTNSYFKIGRFGKSDSDLKFQDIIEGNILDMPERYYLYYVQNILNHLSDMRN